MFNFFKPAPKDIEQTQPEDAFKLAQSDEICLVDVREANEWAQMRLPGAIHAPLSSLASMIEDLPKDKKVVFYCMSGKRSVTAIELSRLRGKAHNAHVQGGIIAWRRAGLPIVA